MMFYRLPPAGNRIELSECHTDKWQLPEFLSSKSYFFDSGASSLAAALVAVIKRSKIPAPEVLMPAYVCPEVVSAILYAGGKPVLVDFEVDRAQMSLEALSRALTANSCAVVAVNLFGIPERLSEIREVIAGHSSLCVVEDSAQAFPEGDEQGGDHGDLVVYSFGRGKPVSVLGGGAVIVRDDAYEEGVASVFRDSPSKDPNEWLVRLKIFCYNRFISPRVYWLPEMLPFMKLGETIYHPLHEITRMDEFRLGLLGENIQCYWSRSRDVQDAITKEISECEKVIDLAKAGCVEAIPRLIRYPILINSRELRDKLYAELRQAMGGVSKMYPAALPGISGIETYFPDVKSIPNAIAFADRLLTLPLHGGVKRKQLDRMLGIIREQSA